MSAPALSPIRVTPQGRYFETFDGRPFLFIGFNDAVSWPRLSGLYMRRDVSAVEQYLDNLAAHGVTILRLMLEYAHKDSHFFEQPVGRFKPRMVQFWDDLLARCEARGLRVLLTPYDTFWMAMRWHKHPNNAVNGGPAHTPQDILLNEAMVDSTIRRLHFVIERWGGSGVIAAWDLHNEIHPHWGGSPEHQSAVVSRISRAVRQKELELHGFTRPQTVSVFGPNPEGGYVDLVFRHPDLDFATTHIYHKGVIDYPQDTVRPAVTMAQWTRHGLECAPPNRPFTDSEHGPIHMFNDHKKWLPEAFDDEYERHMMWAHLACGGAGSGMRWPARHPHVMTDGMLQALRGMSHFARLIDWTRFWSRGAGEDLSVNQKEVLSFGCLDGRQAVVYVLRGDPQCSPQGMCPDREPLANVEVTLRGMKPGAYEINLWNTREGRAIGCIHAQSSPRDSLQWTVPSLNTDLAIAVRPLAAAMD